MIILSPAKINLGLRILNKRSDGYHNIHSFVYPIPLYDIIEMIESPKDRFIQSGIKAGSNFQCNIIYKSLELLRKELNIPPLKIHLHKQIPLQSGLGGGSSNAISFIKLVLYEFKSSEKPELLYKLAVKLGSDCSFFIKSVPSEITGRGEQVKPIKWSLRGIYICVVMPKKSISTTLAYKNIQPLDSPLPFIDNIAFGSYNNHFSNQFEGPAMETIPELKEIKAQLNKVGSFFTSLTGSGSAMYGLFYKKPDIHVNSNYFVWNGVLE
jgi:4-diphosphocytidyl-2-C-methyl-D-erythritol kinase